MYESFYNLTEKPFRIVPNPEYLYLSPKHQAALTYLEYGLSEDAGVILLTGEIGIGKTTLTRRILNQFCKDMVVSVIFNTNLSADELISLVLKGFDQPCNGTSKSEQIEQLNHFLIQKYAGRQKTLLIIDEAQNLSDEALEEVRMLSNLQSDDQILLQIMLVGQPELKRRLLSPALKQFSQRIAVNFHLSALSREETHRYVNYRLEKAGRTAPLFAGEAIDMIYDASGGIPRSINLICDFALVYAFGEEMDPVGVEVIEKVVSEKEGLGLSRKPMAGAVETGGWGVLPEGASDVAQRLTSLETAVSVLRMQCDSYIEKLESKAFEFRDALVNSLTDQLSMERLKNQRLLSQCNQLMRQYRALKKG
ncbi:MAG: AAA family ATPase [Pseudomonadota bacterium]